jgi:hypothetical protein
VRDLEAIERTRFAVGEDIIRAPCTQKYNGEGKDNYFSKKSFFSLQILKFPVVFTGAIHPNYPNPPEGVLG